MIRRCATCVFVETHKVANIGFRAFKTQEFCKFVFVGNICANTFLQEMPELAIEYVEYVSIIPRLLVQKSGTRKRLGVIRQHCTIYPLNA